jgi:hypothetical protein
MVWMSGTFIVGGCLAAKPSDESSIVLPPFSQTYVWQLYTVSKAAPVTADGRYRLNSVRSDRTVELVDCSKGVPNPPLIVARQFQPAQNLGIGERPPTIVLIGANVKSQTATFKVLREKTS